jgi:hypothetical protein
MKAEKTFLSFLKALNKQISSHRVQHKSARLAAVRNGWITVLLTLRE